MIGKFLTAVAATALVAAPVSASAATASTAASKLSVAKSVRASSKASNSNELAGIGIVPALLIAGVAAIGIIAIVKSDDDDADSN